MHFLKRDPGAQRWLELLSRKDQSYDEQIRDDFTLLQALMQPANWHFMPPVLASLARGGSTDGVRERLIESYRCEHAPLESAIAKEAEVFETGSGRRIGWVDLRLHRGHFNISRLVIEKHDVDLVATVIWKEVILGGEAIDRGVDLSHLHGDHVQGDVPLRIAGHKSPILIKPTNGRVDDLFIVAVRAFIKEML